MKITKVSNTTNTILKTAGIAACCVVPAAYMTKFHMDLYNKNDTKNRVRIRNKMIGFLGGVGISSLLIHKRIKIGSRVFLNSVNKPVKHTFKIIGALIAPFVGLEGAKWINKKS